MSQSIWSLGEISAWYQNIFTLSGSLWRYVGGEARQTPLLVYRHLQINIKCLHKQRKVIFWWHRRCTCKGNNAVWTVSPGSMQSGTDNVNRVTGCYFPATCQPSIAKPNQWFLVISSITLSASRVPALLEYILISPRCGSFIVEADRSQVRTTLSPDPAPISCSSRFYMAALRESGGDEEERESSSEWKWPLWNGPWKMGRPPV